ncbi:hypothetical protein M8C21_012303 [Ambrosia artemisiifolia]|uniref:F-box associated beta-propeller type 1 domain-containing protein n=1 Tax=Ambrosia artemisiifolia TaxID=4212 RepID=A0AAD5GEI4_AMBAR|nr:hypothetical protein M8C21_012303 [Ambrosia artemisiifolia]
MAADNRSLIELPPLNLEDILSKLPLRSLVFCCCLSKPLLNLLKNDPGFARTCFEKSESQLMINSAFCRKVHLIDLDADTHPALAERVEIQPTFKLPLHGFEVTHSCNGLVLLENCNMDDNEVHRCVVCNPVTGEYIMLPVSTVFSKHVSSAFFYCPVTNQFKIFRAFHRVYLLSQDSESFLNSDPDPRIRSNLFPDGIYDFDSDSDHDNDFDSDSNYSESDRMGEFLIGGSDYWEPIDSIPFSPLTIHSPCYLDNATHWLCADESVHNLIVSFNFETGQFGEIPGPTHLKKAHANVPDYVNMVSLDGCLSIFDNYTKKTRFDVWKMKEYGVKGSWTKAFVIDTTAWGVYRLHYSFTPVICRNNGEVVMVSNSGYIILHDLLKKRGRIVFYPALEYPSKAVAHTPSLMPLSDVTRGTNMVVRKVASRSAPPKSNKRNYLQLSTTYSE